MTQSIRRCFGNGPNQQLLAHYHDHEWGKPSRDDRHLFEMLCLEGAQAGLNWETILKKRKGYKEVFHNFDPKKVATMTESELEAAARNPLIVRNKLKIRSVVRNARVFINIQKEFGSFADYVWRFVGGNPIVFRPKTVEEAPVQTKESQALSKDLKKRGMTFVGPTIIYAFMQACGLVNDHAKTCQATLTRCQ